MNNDTMDALLSDYYRPRPAAAGLGRRIAARARGAARLLRRDLGALAIEASERGIVAVRPGDRGTALPRAARRLAERAREELAEYFEGRRSFFTVPIDLRQAPPFQLKVLRQTARIPFGEARSYSWLARRIGHPGAARAVGTALGRNPVPFLVPCHRVLRGDGSLGGYGLGLPLKRRLLTLERLTPVLTGSTTTGILCRVGCPAQQRTRSDREVVFASIADGRSVGYRPCRICRPDDHLS